MFQSREQAGEQLVQKLSEFKGKENAVVLGIPRGGVVTASVIVSALNLPLDIVVVKKIGAPDNPELAIGAVGPLKTVYWDENLLRKLEVSKNQRLNIKNQKEKEREKREKLLRGDRKPLNLRNKTVILVDDGIATGATVLAAQKFLQKVHTKQIILAVPVVAVDTLREIERYFDRVIALEVPSEFYAVGQFYEDFPQVEDEEVVAILNSK